MRNAGDLVEHDVVALPLQSPHSIANRGGAEHADVGGVRQVRVDYPDLPFLPGRYRASGELSRIWHPGCLF